MSYASESNFAAPPRLAFWLLTLFAADHSESIVGDLHEEFLQVAAESGIAFARRWYWRQTLNTIAHLALTSFRAAPLATTAAVMGGYFFIRLVSPERAIFAILQHYQLYENHFTVYRFFASTGIDIAMLLRSLFIGYGVALVSKRREMITATALALIMMALTLAASVVWIKDGSAAFLWRMPWFVADSLAIVAGGVLVRMHRSRRLFSPVLS